METKEEMLAYIKAETGWDDAKCLEWFTQQEEADRSANEEVANVWHAYYYMEDDEPKFVMTQIEPTAEIMDRVEDYERTSSKPRAKELIKKWKDISERELEWDKYINRK